MLIDLPTYTLVHVVISVLGIVAGIVVMGGLMAGVLFRRWTALFLSTTVLTSVSGYGFPFVTLLPSHIVGAISLVVLVIAIVALYVKHLAGAWRQAFVVFGAMALYLNAFVLMAQLLQKTPILAKLAPDPKAPAFAVTQLVVLVLFVGLGWAAMRGFRQAGFTGAAATRR